MAVCGNWDARDGKRIGSRELPRSWLVRVGGDVGSVAEVVFVEFKEWFCLNARESFTIDPLIYPSDAQFYFGRSDIKAQLVAQINKSFIVPGIPKIVLYGAYGSGKTQTLHHIDYLLTNDPPKSLRHKPKPVHVVLEMASKSTYGEWHLQLMEGPIEGRSDPMGRGGIQQGTRLG